MQNLKFEAIGTSWSIDLYDVNRSDTERLLQIIISRIEEFDKAYSRFREDSLVWQISKSAGAYILPEDAKPMLELYEKMLELTGGKLTPLIGAVLSDAGYDATYSLSPKSEIPKAKNWNEVAKFDGQILTTKEPLLLDFGAIGKGYLIDIVAEILRSEGVTSFTVEAGGDMAHQSQSGEKLKVGLEDPEDTKKIIGVAEIANTSLCGSSGNRRAWDIYHHIIDPDTIKSPSHILAIWVEAPTTMLADALTTALFFVEPQNLQESFDFKYAIMYKGRSVSSSPDFPGNFFTN